ncbi:putative serine/threonine-protein kinase isoform X1 [Helianthus annuus]|uniref:putative serine/threonine-protein kinase isoform X1 n=2 Tax=Helianthus annuus TaxID=4232 RepID=UPI000B8F51C9|nr:putative serine/threonine-protein kinase isoform X1 [Helianthus annuus]XP_022036021.1 putative serine/threonine-protein kinase isoform X1 [Helianthus annuus]XP_022036022.1 putative serine/threonine-protein kinase isoform X1 [Helianthus annuus]XP_022036023.1 putative serine/threonine-protein kinase isoform X1 [Helianthus annuus]XP_035844666.1 putative serine/threonine-protein kinase isoform X1 [Helianthus annuus]
MFLKFLRSSPFIIPYQGEIWIVNQPDMSCSCFGSSRVQKKETSTHRELEGYSLDNVRNFSYKELRLATDNFDRSTKIGRGGFGVVYKGILKDGKQVAVKTLSAESKQGVREFLAEINAISNVRHQNLVELIGCCVEGTHRILVYEFVENNSLDHALLRKKSNTIELDWEQRSKIMIGTARGLAYLHEELDPHIVHRDIKASNILLDKDFTPKIGDFGLARLFPDSITHISTKLAGTTGYLAPEYVLGGRLTLKADVYSFGVLMLETISGRSSSLSTWGISQKVLLEWAWELYEEGRLLELVDPDLKTYPEDDVIKYIKVAFFCTQATANRRPLMSQVVDMLSRNIKLNEKELTPPAIFQDSNDNKKTSGASTSRLISSFPSTITQVIPR